MLKKYCSVSILILLLVVAVSGQQQDCVFKLQEAEKLYSDGLIENIPGLLNPCIRKGLAKEDKLQAYKIVILSYLFDDDQENAEKTMLEFLKFNPEYEISPTDPEEFIYLFNSYSNNAIYSFGISGGLNLTNIFIREQWGNYDYNSSTDEYKAAGFGYQVRLNINRYIADNLEFVFEIMLKQNKFENMVTIPDFNNNNFNQQTFSETQTRFEVPLSITYDFEYGKIKPYLRAGASIGYLINTFSKIQRSYIDNSTNADLKSPDLNISDYRNKFNYWGVIGGGIKYRIPRGYIIFDVRYNIGLLNQTNINNRIIKDSEQTWKYHYMDDNFILNNGSVSVGYVYLLYKPERKQ